METDNIPFKIGMQYENWEFNLDILPDIVKGLDSYLNIDESLNKFLNVHSDKTELIFRMDILEGVILTFENRTSSFYRDLKENVFPKLNSLELLDIEYLSECEDRSNSLAYCIVSRYNKLYIFYCREHILTSILETLIM